MNNKTKKKVIVTNSLLLAFLIFGTVFAWFASNFKNYVAANEVQVVADGDLQLSVEDTTDNSKWSYSLTLSNYEWFKRTSFTDITGSGDGNFARPTLQLNPGFASIAETGTWTTTEKDDTNGQLKATNTADNDKTSKTKYDFVRFTLYMRSKTKMNVQLGPGSCVLPASIDSASDLGKLIGVGAPNRSSFGLYSKDLVAGAVRVSAIDSEKNHLFTWIPRPEINAFAKESSVSRISVNETENETTGDSYSHTYYADVDNNKKFKEYTLGDIDNPDKALTVTGDITGSQNLVTLSEETDTNGYHTGKVDFCIWLEGCDNEARRVFVDGKFKVFLNLSAIPL